jgi:hypothetical protein
MAQGSALAVAAAERAGIGLALPDKDDAHSAARAPAVYKTIGYLEDAGLLLLAVYLLPLVILIVGAPIAILVRVMVEIAQRL